MLSAAPVRDFAPPSIHVGTLRPRRERVEIADRRQAGETVRVIAAALGRAPSMVSRELCRNGTRTGRDPLLLASVKDSLAQRWSPSQICRALRREFSDRPDWHLAPETFYQELYRPESLLLRRLGAKIRHITKPRSRGPSVPSFHAYVRYDWALRAPFSLSNSTNFRVLIVTRPPWLGRHRPGATRSETADVVGDLWYDQIRRLVVRGSRARAMDVCGVARSTNCISSDHR